jgi:hypothetical protein
MAEVLDRLYRDLAEVEAGRRKCAEEAQGLVAEWDERLAALEERRDAAVKAGDIPEYRQASRDMAHAMRMRDLAAHEWDADDPDDPYHPDWSADVPENEHQDGE